MSVAPGFYEQRRTVLLVPPGTDRAPSQAQVDEVRVDDTITEPGVIEEPSVAGFLSESQRQAFRNARAANDLQGQLDVLFEAFTGQSP